MSSSRCAGIIRLAAFLYVFTPAIAHAGFYDYGDKQTGNATKEGLQGNADSIAQTVQDNIGTMRANRVEAVMSIASPSQKELLNKREKDRLELERTFQKH